MTASNSPSPAAAPLADSRASGSRISRPSIWNPPQTPTTSVLLAAGELLDPLGQPVAAKAIEVGQRVLAAGKDDGVGLAKVRRLADDSQPHVALAAEGVEVGEVRDVRQIDDGDFDRLAVAAGGVEQAALEFHRVFLRQAKVREIGNNPQDRAAGRVLRVLQGRREQARRRRGSG